MQTAVDLHGRHLMTLNDYTREEISYLIDLAADLKTAKSEGWEQPSLTGKQIALIFEQDSLRTRCVLEVAAHDQGAHVTFIGAAGARFGQTETVKDIARLLGRMYDAIEYRGVDDRVAEGLAAWAEVPVYRGLTDEWHPAQILADFLTCDEHLDKPLDEIAFCYLGDARRNLAGTLLVAGARLGMDARIAGPRELWPAQEALELARRRAKLSGGQLTVTEDLHEGVTGCDVLLADTWVSPGEPAEVWRERISMLLPYQINARALELTGNPHIKFMHCLPAVHSSDTTFGAELSERYGLSALEVTDEVFESHASLVFAEAENRMHMTKAVLVATLAG
jgi:ornithine carbamoyltransferase